MITTQKELCELVLAVSLEEQEIIDTPFIVSKELFMELSKIGLCYASAPTSNSGRDEVGMKLVYCGTQITVKV